MIQSIQLLDDNQANPPFWSNQLVVAVANLIVRFYGWETV